MNFSRRGFMKVAGYSVAGAGLTWCRISSRVEAKDRVVKLFNGNNLDGWYTFLRSKGKNNDSEIFSKLKTRWSTFSARSSVI